MHRGKQQASSNRKFTSSLCLVRPTRRFTRATRGLRGGSTRAPVGARRRAEACPRQPHAGQDPGTDSSRGQDLGLHVHRQSLGLGGSVSTGTRHFRRPPSLRRNGLWEPGWSAAKDRAAQTSEVSEVASGQRPGAALVPVGEAMCPLPCEGGATPADGPHGGSWVRQHALARLLPCSLGRPHVHSHLGPRGPDVSRAQSASAPPRGVSFRVQAHAGPVLVPEAVPQPFPPRPTYSQERCLPVPRPRQRLSPQGVRAGKSDGSSLWSLWKTSPFIF